MDVCAATAPCDWGRDPGHAVPLMRAVLVSQASSVGRGHPRRCSGERCGDGMGRALRGCGSPAREAEWGPEVVTLGIRLPGGVRTVIGRGWEV